MIAAWHPMEPAAVLAWWEDDDVLPWVLEVDGGACGYGELWLDPEENEVELARLIVPEAQGDRGEPRACVRPAPVPSGEPPAGGRSALTVR